MTKAQEIELNVALVEKNAYFEQIQEIFDCSKKAFFGEAEKQEFLSSSMDIEYIRDEFRKCVSTCNRLTLEINPDKPLIDQSLVAFNKLFSKIKYVRDQLSSFKTDPNPQGTSSVRLPPMELVSFDGNIQSWSQFYATFNSNVHLNSNLTDEEKMYYLLSKLTGKAKNIVAGISPDGSNYNLMYQTLKERFQNKRLLAATYIKQILTFKSSEKSSVKNLESFLDIFVSSYKALQNLKVDDLFDFMILNIALGKIDNEVVNWFELNNTASIPKFESLVECIRHRIKVLENFGSNQRDNSGLSLYQRKLQSHAFLTNEDMSICKFCKDSNHQFLYRCPKFLESSSNIRFDIVKQLKLCLNCLKENCFVKTCKSINTCKICSKKHHTLLHFEKAFTPENTHNNVPEVSLCSTLGNRKKETILLATAIVKTKSQQGKWVSMRVLIDNGSQSDFITDACAKRLNLKIFANCYQSYISGFGGSKHPVLGCTNIIVYSRHNEDLLLELKPLVVNKISNKIPTSEIDISGLSYLKNLPLADNDFNVPRDIDMIIGARSFPFLLKSGKILLKSNLPSAIETMFGYVVMGAVASQCNDNCEYDEVTFCTTTLPSVDRLLTKFWELENIPDIAQVSPEERECENIYINTTIRQADGTYSVKLPFKDNPLTLGDSFQIAKRRFLTLERRLAPTLKKTYDDVVKEHLEKGYLSPSTNESFGYYIPHHPVIREDKVSTKLRMVLDASAKTDNGISLNDILHGGENLQICLFTILLNLRLFPIVVSADIKQMYLQIRVNKDDRRFQRILYRFEPNSQLLCYEYNCVTFGMKCSPFLALRTIRQLATDEASKYPLASVILNRDIYMDDVASSVSSEQEAVELSKQLITIFRSGGFDLVKFSSNSSEVLKHVPETSRLSKVVEFQNDEVLKILGMHWFPGEDIFTFKVDANNKICTKRNILSTIARLWDIMGFVAPVTLYAKLLLRTIWLLKLDWDDTPPPNIISVWEQFLKELPLLESFVLPRHVGVFSNGCTLTVIGFADASEKAYGGVVYLHIKNNNLNTTVYLLCAKSRVAPLKTISLARLELCGILILSKLMKSVVDTYSSRHKISQVIGFSDSTVALNWINSSPHRWETFVANRVTKIQELIEPNLFYHIDGKINPADCLSRGLTPSQIVNHNLWKQGPDWLNRPCNEWPIKRCKFMTDIPEEKLVSFVSLTKPLPYILELASYVSSWSRLLYRFVYIYRFLKILPRRNLVTSADLNFVERKILIALQHYYFSKEIIALQTNSICSRSFQRLQPFIKNSIILVGGRLNRSDLNYQQQHPIILPKRDHIVNLLIDYYHKIFSHAGPDLLLSILRQQYWIFSARTVIRNRIHKCVKCFRLRPKPLFPEMADLKSCQILQTVKPFIHTGTDFAGPFKVTVSRRRGNKCQKAYVCLFVCLTTKAVHIELASDLSTSCFLAALKRFLSRRGPISDIYSDCGRNYVGAKSYLNELYQLLLSSSYNEQFNQIITENRINWHFNAPAAPHFGGVWESNVKSFKTHLFRIIGQQILSFEEMSTVLVQIEAIMNSRPICRILSSDPAEPLALTPAHFLNLTPLKFLPALQVSEEHLNLGSRYTLLDKLVQSFWKRWRNEYLHTLQVRQKWNTPSNPIRVGNIIILSTENCPPLQWPLGIVEEILPGKDGIVRVAKVRTKTGVYVRPTVRLCPLPEQ